MEEPELFKAPVGPPKKKKPPKEFKVVALRDCPMPRELDLCDAPQRAADYWRMHIATTPQFNPDCECFAVLLLNTRLRVKGHQIVAVGLLDQVLVHAREVFRTAIVAAAHSILLLHNHSSGDPTPSEADIRITRDLIRAGQLLRIEVTDHIIVGMHKHCSLKALGHFHK